jgi:hypothetical protein
MCLTFADTPSKLSSFTSLGIDSLHIEDNTSLGSLSTPCQGGMSKSSKEPSQDTATSLAGTLISTCDPGSVARGTNASVQTGDSETKKAVREGYHDNIELGQPLSKVTSLTSSERPQLVSDLSQPKLPPPNNFELSNLDSAVEDASSQGSSMSDTSSNSDGEWLAGRTLSIAWEISEQHDLTTFPTFDSKWMVNFTNHAGHQGSVSTSTNTSRSAKHSASTSLSSQDSRKSLSGNHGDYPADGDDDPPERPRLNPSRPQNLDSSVKLACPFFKHDPRKYNPCDYHTCATTAWNSIRRLK